MNGRRTIVGLCTLCALLASAVAAQSASAITGTTIFTCNEESEAKFQFKDSHCKEESSGGNTGKFKHVQIPQDTSTELAGHAVGTMVVKTTVAGQAVSISATTVTGSGTVENKVDASGEHYVMATASGVYSGLSVSVPKCFAYRDEAGVKGEKGVIDTEQLTTTSLGQGDFVKFTPVTGEVISRFWILDSNKKTPGEGGECSIGGTLTITGSVRGKPNGATFVFNHSEITTENTFKCSCGSKAGFEGTIAVEGKDPKVEKDTFKPLSVTTVST